MNFRALKHFEKEAQEYSDFRKKGILGRLVDKEIKGIMRFLPDLKNKNVLDLGCGTGLYTKILKDRGANVFAADFSFLMAKETKKVEDKILVSSINDFKFKKKFDVILCSGAIEFIKDQEGAIKNISEHLKSGGVFITLYPRRSIGGFLYGLYHKLVNGIILTILPMKKFESLLNMFFLNESGEFQKITVNFINYVLKVQKHG